MATDMQLIPTLRQILNPQSQAQVQLLLLQLLTLLQRGTNNSRCAVLQDELQQEKLAHTFERERCKNMEMQLMNGQCNGAVRDLNIEQMKIENIKKEIQDIEVVLENKYTPSSWNKNWAMSIKEEFLPEQLKLAKQHQALRRIHEKYIEDLDNVRASIHSFFKSYQNSNDIYITNDKPDGT